MIEGHVEARLGAFALAARFAFPSRGVTALFGPSGCGKTTLLRALAGVLPRAQGRLVVEGETWMDRARGVFLPPERRAVGFVFQHAALFPHLTVRGNVEYALQRVRGRTPARLEALVERTGIGHLLERFPSTLSGGERQRVAIARALASAPRLLLMDEPLSALDRDSRSVLLPYLEELHASLELPVVYVSHAPEEVARLAARVLRMQGGAIVEELSVEAFRAGLPPLNRP